MAGWRMSIQRIAELEAENAALREENAAARLIIDILRHRLAEDVTAVPDDAPRLGPATRIKA